MTQFENRPISTNAERGIAETQRLILRRMTLDAIVSPLNKASVRLLEKLGLNFQRGITIPGEKEEIGLYSMILS